MIVNGRRSARVRHTSDQAAAAALVVLGLAAYAGHAASAKHAASTAHTVAVAGPQMSAADANVATGKRMAAAYGWTGAQWSCLDALWTRESSWSDTAANPTSDARGIAQDINGWSAANPYGNAPAQIAWGLNYIRARYGSPCGAWAHETSAGWY